jgi:hypothetical protein
VKNAGSLSVLFLSTPCFLYVWFGDFPGVQCTEMEIFRVVRDLPSEDYLRILCLRRVSPLVATIGSQCVKLCLDQLLFFCLKIVFCGVFEFENGREARLFVKRSFGDNYFFSILRIIHIDALKVAERGR